MSVGLENEDNTFITKILEIEKVEDSKKEIFEQIVF